MKLIRTMNNGGGTAVTHGSACWTAIFLESLDSYKVIETRVGVISGDDLRDGVDVDSFIVGIWNAADASGYMELRLMLCSGKVVTIDSVKDSAGCQVLSVRHDEKTFPSGLTGRWVDHLAGRQTKRVKAVA
jgi:hypothetical protein